MYYCLVCSHSSYLLNLSALEQKFTEKTESNGEQNISLHVFPTKLSSSFCGPEKRKHERYLRNVNMLATDGKLKDVVLLNTLLKLGLN